jgi:predicted transcriptional regulator
MPATPPPPSTLSRRERQIMDVIFRMGRATAAEVHERIPHPPSLTAVRTMLRNLEGKGHLRHEEEGPRYVYLPMVERASAARSAVDHVLRTFFGGSPGAAVAALLSASERPLSERERDELVELIRRQRDEGR